MKLEREFRRSQRELEGTIKPIGNIPVGCIVIVDEKYLRAVEEDAAIRPVADTMQLMINDGVLKLQNDKGTWNASHFPMAFVVLEKFNPLKSHSASLPAPLSL